MHPEFSLKAMPRKVNVRVDYYEDYDDFDDYDYGIEENG